MESGFGLKLSAPSVSHHLWKLCPKVSISPRDDERRIATTEDLVWSVGSRQGELATAAFELIH